VTEPVPESAEGRYQKTFPIDVASPTSPPCTLPATTAAYLLTQDVAPQPVEERRPFFRRHAGEAPDQTAVSGLHMLQAGAMAGFTPYVLF
jgi:hypothetical protein